MKTKPRQCHHEQIDFTAEVQEMTCPECGRMYRRLDDRSWEYWEPES